MYHNVAIYQYIVASLTRMARTDEVGWVPEKHYRLQGLNSESKVYN